MNGIMGGGYNLPLNSFWKEENKKLKRASFNFAQDELHKNEEGN